MREFDAGELDAGVRWLRERGVDVNEAWGADGVGLQCCLTIHLKSPAGDQSAGSGRLVGFEQGWVVARDGIEPPTRGFSIPCSTN